MEHMIRRFGSRYSADDPERVDWTVQKAEEYLREAHQILVAGGHEAVKLAAEKLGSEEQWGTNLKRHRASISRSGFLMPGQSAVHNLVEVINMCATVERVLDTLTWAKNNYFADYTVECCHPTASSDTGARKSGEFDHDLVLVRTSEKTKDYARFEISDVSGDGDGNDKERKDLVSLDVLVKKEKGQIWKTDDALKISGWPQGHLFLAVSQTFGERVMRAEHTWSKRDSPHCIYLPHKAGSRTTILEIVDGKKGRDIECKFSCCLA